MKPDPIKATIIELCPDVMELKRGCEIQWRGETALLTGKTYTMGDNLGSIPAKKFWVVDHNISGVDSFSENNSGWEILGSPITLAVVLRAIMRVKMSDNANFKPTQDGVTVPFLDAENLAYYWDLLHDNYDQQSEDCKQFIGSLLGV